jgi:hypothetical protein
MEIPQVTGSPLAFAPLTISAESAQEIIATW